MSLLEIYEELFQYVCRLNRASKTDAHPDFARVRAEVKTLLDEVTRKVSGDVRLANQVKRLELPVTFFVDNLVCTSRLKFATQWADNRLAKEKNELAGDERFFDFLEEDLVDTSEDAAERLSIYYVCLGLGFMGMYQGQPEQLRIYMEKIFPRIRQWMDVDSREDHGGSLPQHGHADVDGTAQPQNHFCGHRVFVFVAGGVVRDLRIVCCRLP